jgi:hypothetical protein
MYGLGRTREELEDDSVGTPDASDVENNPEVLDVATSWSSIGVVRFSRYDVRGDLRIEALYFADLKLRPLNSTIPFLSIRLDLLLKDHDGPTTSSSVIREEFQRRYVKLHCNLHAAASRFKNQTGILTAIRTAPRDNLTHPGAITKPDAFLPFRPLAQTHLPSNRSPLDIPKRQASVCPMPFAPVQQGTLRYPEPRINHSLGRNGSCTTHTSRRSTIEESRRGSMVQICV